MPKTQAQFRKLRESWIKDLPNNKHFRIDGKSIFCEPCGNLYHWGKKFQLDQHLKGDLHKKNAERHSRKPEVQMLLNSGDLNGRNPFFEDLCEAFIAADISWNKLENPVFINFLEKYTAKTIPCRSTLQKNYIKRVYAKSIETIRENIGNYPIWLSVDETTDAKGRYIANVLVGPLNKDRPEKSYLLMCKQLEHTNNSTVTKLVLDAFLLLWPNCKQEEIEKKFLLFVTDSVAYMMKTGKNLKAMYPNLLHVSCKAHALNLVAEEIRSFYPEIDKMIGAVKAVFRKAPSRILKYKEMYPELDLPPNPVYTRWGTWLEAVDTLGENHVKVAAVINTFDSGSAKCIEIAQSLLQNQDVVQQLTYLTANFTFLSKKLTQIQGKNIPLSDAVNIVDSVKNQLSSAKGNIATMVLQKFTSVIVKNEDYSVLEDITKIIDGQHAIILKKQLNPNIIAAFKYAPITSVDCERSFSMHKSLLHNRRLSMTMDNIELTLVSHYTLLVDQTEK